MEIIIKPVGPGNWKAMPIVVGEVNGAFKIGDKISINGCLWRVVGWHAHATH